jgi:hypothetical protein
MRTLTSTLSAAVAASTRRPYITLTAEDHINHLAQSISTPGNSAAISNACVANDGSIVRVRLTRGGNALQQSFQWQRVSDPASASQWSAWTTFGGGSGNMFEDGGCCVSNNNGTLRAFAQQGSSGNNIYVWTSTNNGQSWSGSPGSVLAPPSNALCKGMSSAGNNDVFFFYDVLGGEALGCSFYSGSWSSLHTWSFSAIPGCSGLAVVWVSASGLYYIIYSDGYTLKECTATSNGATWSTLPDIAPATSTAIGRANPRLTLDSQSGLYTLIVSEIDSGALTGSVYSYPRVRQSADLLHWSSGYILHDATTQYSAALVNTSSATYIISMPSIFQSPAFSQANANQYVDVSSRILSYSRQEHSSKTAKLEIVLDNHDGALSSLVGTQSNYQPISPNTSVILSEGYLTGTPPTTKEVVKVGTYHINQIQFERSPEENQIRLICYDKTRNLDIVNRFQMTYFGQTISWLITEVCARAGFFSPSLPSTSQMSQTVPTFVLQSNQTYRRALDELCNTYALEYFLDQNEVLQFKEKSGGDASVWTYQPEIELVTFGSDDLRGNHVIVTGRPPVGGTIGSLTTSEAYDDSNAHFVGLERLIHVIDQKLTTTAACQLRANFVLAQEQRAEKAHQVVVPANPALQLLDVVTLQDVAGGSQQGGTARIIQQQVHYDAQHATYEQVLDLEGV